VYNLLFYKFTYLKDKKGFSLIELMVVVAVLSIVILGLVTFFTAGTRSWVSGQSQLKAQREARQTMDRMVKEIRHGQSATLNSTELIESITVHIPALSDSSAYYVTFAFVKSGRYLNRIVNSVSSTPLLDNVTALEFTLLDSAKLDILFEVDVDDDSNPDITLKTHVRLRNFGI
jgi:prepilin-type N-terminal cleavage/methylation domain-containing protein